MQHQYCTHCGQVIDPRGNFCPHCGARILTTSQPQQHPPIAAPPIQTQQVQAPPPPAQPIAGSPAVQTQPMPNPAEAPSDSDIIPRRHLAPRAKVLFFMNYVGLTAILLPFMVAFAFFDLLFAVILTVSYFALCYIAAIITYNSFYFSIDQNGFEKDHGIFFKKHVSIPFDQIQNVNTLRTIIDRFLGVGRLEIETAGSSSTKKREVAGGIRSHSEGYLPGISASDARRFHDILLRKTKERVASIDHTPAQ